MTATKGSAAPAAIDASTRRGYGHLAPWIIAAVLVLLLPRIFATSSALTVMNQMAITIVFALSYNMLLGQGGMLSFGHAVYMGLGGFFCVHLINMVEYDGLPLPLPLLPLFGGLFGLLFATIVGAFSTRRAGTVFAMISLGVGELIAACSIIVVAFFGGEEGISGDRTMGPTILGLDFASQKEVYYLTIIWMFVAAIAMYLYARTPIGSLANAVRDNEERAEYLGYSQRKVRFISFCAAGFFAGIAGGLFAINFEILTEENLNLATSGSVLLVTFLGGTGFFVGPIVGAVVFTLLQTVLSLYTEIWQLYLGLLFVLTVMFFPQGLTGLVAIHWRPYKLGKIDLLVRPYLLMALPLAAFALSVVCVLEILFHTRHAAIGEDTMSLFGISFDASGPLPLLGASALLVVSLFLMTRRWPTVRDAWADANEMEASP